MLATKKKETKQRNIKERGIGGWNRMIKGNEQQEDNFKRTSKCHLVNPLFFQR